MKDDKLFRAIGNIDEELVDRAAPTGKTARKPSTGWLRWALPLAACFVVAVVVAVPIMLNRPVPSPVADNVADNDTSSGAYTGGEVVSGGGGVLPGGVYVEDSPSIDSLRPATIDGIRGLPTSDYTWDEGGGIAYDRMAMSELRFLMREFDSYDPNVKAAFTVVVVDSVEPFAEDNGRGVTEGQIAYCGVLFDVLGNGIVEPLRVKQYLYGGCANSEQTNLLRVGGVYVLPLVTQEAPENYYDLSDGSWVIWNVYGDLDVLFKVDDKGLIHSHSREPGLNKYDGLELAYLWKDAGYLSMNPILVSRLAENIGQGYEVEITGDTVKLVFPANGWNEEDSEGFSAKIAGGRVSIATSGFNVFRPVEGMTVDELNDAVIKIWQFVGLLSDEPLLTPVYAAETTPIPFDAYEKPAVPINLSPEDAEIRLIEEYARQGFGAVYPTLEAVTTLWESVDVYLFLVDTGVTGANEYAGIVIENGNLIRLEKLPDGGFAAMSGAVSPNEPVTSTAPNP